MNYVFRDIKRYISEYGLLYFDTLDKKKSVSINNNCQSFLLQDNRHIHRVQCT